MRPCFKPQLALVAVFAAGAAALAVGGEFAATPIKALMPDLDSADYATREAAREMAAVSPEISLRDIEAALTVEKLSAEQRARLMVAAHERFVRGPRAALGVQMAAGGIPNPAPEPGVRLGAVFPNFPSAGVLLAGDRVLEMNGEPVQMLGDGSASFRPLVISRDPGDTVRVRLNRGGVERTVDVPLGRYADLPNLGMGGRAGLSEVELTAAWVVRSAAYATKWEEAAPIVAPLNGDRWGVLGEEPIRRDGQRAPALSLVAGGRPRGSLESARDYDERLLVRNNGGLPPGMGRRLGQRGVRGGGAGWQQGPGVVVQLGPVNPLEQAATEKRLREISTRRAQAVSELRAAQQLLRNTALPPEQQAAAVARASEIENELLALSTEQAVLTNRSRGVMVAPARP